MQPPLATRARRVLDLVLPRDCAVCATPLRRGWPGCCCAPCRRAMRRPTAPLCPCCGIPLPDRLAACPDCTRSPPRFHAARAAAVYRPGASDLNPLARAVQRLKYDGMRPVAVVLGALLAARWPFPGTPLLVPVPLHPRRLRRRGFNQALLLARALGQRRGLDVAAGALVRRRHTTAQSGLGAAARRANLADAFAVGRPDLVANRHVVLVDDVLTTGATADACAAVLRAAGARRVDVYTVGRVP